MTRALSLTCIVNVDVAAVVGVPDSVPPCDTDNPAGRVPDDTLQLYGGVPPEAARGCGV